MTSKETISVVLREFGKAKALAVRELGAEDNFTADMADSSQVYIPEFKQMNFTADMIGYLWQYNGTVYQLLQANDAASNIGWNPESTPALWRTWHTNDPSKAKPWVDQVGTIKLYYKGNVYKEDDGTVYRSTRESGTNHRATVYPADWEIVPV